ncbi:MAG: carbohydrate ABC transporter permease [Spirochaetaceae bacterium]|nr:MAG: carbohydrate ABC transporter permease [Spirochaetaceae bacterium]
MVRALTREDRVVTTVVYVTLSVIFLVVAYPLYFVVIASVSDPFMVSTGQVWAFPRGITFEGYERIFTNQEIVTGYRNSIMYAVVGTAVNLAITLTAAYALSRSDLVGRNAITFIFAFTMFFSGGIIPLFLLVRGLGLYNTFWAMIFPTALSVWNLIIARTFFQSTIPKELLDSAKVDGCTDFRFFWSIVLPLSTAIVAVLLIFYAVAHWNAFFNALIFLRSRSRFPLQLVLRDILIQHQFSDDMMVDDASAEVSAMIAESMKYGVIIVASVPVMILYPFVQKHYVRGIMIGAIKG